MAEANKVVIKLSIGGRTTNEFHWTPPEGASADYIAQEMNPLGELLADRIIEYWERVPAGGTKDTKE